MVTGWTGIISHRFGPVATCEDIILGLQVLLSYNSLDLIAAVYVVCVYIYSKYIPDIFILVSLIQSYFFSYSSSCLYKPRDNWRKRQKVYVRI